MKNLFTLCFISVTVALITLELVIRIFFAENMSGRFEYGYHPTAGFIEENDGTVNLVRAGGRRFRPQSFQMPKPKGTFRVFVVGDSVPRGPSLEGAYAEQLEELLKKEEVQAEVLNLGIAGNGIRRSRIIMDQVFQYEPDLILFHLNYSNEYEDEREWRRAQDFKSWHPSHWLTKSLLVARLFELKTEKIYWFWLPEKIRQAGESRDQDQETLALNDAELRKIWDKRLVENTADLKKRAHEKKMPVLIIVQSTFGDGDQRNTLGTARSLRFLKPAPDVLTMQSVFEKNPEGRSLFMDGTHMKPKAHALLAEKIKEKIIPLADSYFKSRKP